MNTEIVSTAKDVLSNLGGRLVENAPLVATGIGITGIVGTGLLAFQAGGEWANVKEVISEIDSDEELDKLDKLYEKAKIVVPVLGPPIALGGITIASVVIGQRITWGKYQVLAATYQLTQGQFSDYKDKVKEVLGENKEAEIRDALALEAARGNVPDPEKEYIIRTDCGEELCLDTVEGRWFRSSSSALHRAKAAVYEQLNSGDAVTLNDFYEFLALPPTKLGSELMWYPGDNPWIAIAAELREEDDALYYALTYEIPSIDVRFVPR